MKTKRWRLVYSKFSITKTKEDKLIDHLEEVQEIATKRENVIWQQLLLN